MILTTILFLVAAEPVVSSADTGTVVVESGPLNIPDEIAPAVIPYMACLTASKGSPLRNSPNGAEVFPGKYKAGDDCSEVRSQASKNADKMLRGSRSKDQRSELINSTLASIDRFIGALPQLTGPSIQAPEQLANDAGPPAVERELKAIDNQMLGWEATILGSGPTASCKTSKSSGDPKLDALACQAMAECAARMPDVSALLNDPSVTADERKKIIRESNGEMTACVTTRRAELFRSLAQDRAAALQKASNATN